MNQRRLTCLSTVVITTVLAPIATVCSKPLPSMAVEPASYHQGSPRSLPIITPLIVTELETDAAVPTASIITPQPNRSVVAANSKKIGKIPTTKSSPDLTKLPQVPTFDSSLQVTTPAFSGSKIADSFAPNAQRVSSIPSPTSIPRDSSRPNSGLIGSTPNAAPDTEAIKIRVLSPSILVMRSAASQFSSIINASTAEANLAGLPQVEPTNSQSNELSDSPSAAGVPIYSFGTDRPQQIVATTIVQADNTQIQTSISTPVQRSDSSPTIDKKTTKKADKLIAYKSNSPSSESILDRIVATQTGKASWYGAESGPKTANGERFNPNGLTAAHRTLPFGTKVRVTSLKTGKSVTLRINDRGPFHSNRILDVSAGAAQAIGIKKDGIGTIRMEVLAAK